MPKHEGGGVSTHPSMPLVHASPLPAWPAARTVDLRDLATTLDADPDVQVLQAVAAQQQHRLKRLEAQNVGLHQLQGGACAHGCQSGMHGRDEPSCATKTMIHGAA